MTYPELFVYFNAIAKMYGFKVYYTTDTIGGFFDAEGSALYIGKWHNKEGYVSAFFHELAHGCLWAERAHPAYHSFDFEKKHLGTWRGARIALNGELATDKRGKELCNLWMPGAKYSTGYKNNKKTLTMLYKFHNLIKNDPNADFTDIV